MAARYRKALIEAADHLLGQRAANSITVTDVVTTAAMSRPTFYQHFDGLGPLFAAAGLARLERIFTAEATAPSSRTLADHFASLIAHMEANHQFLYHVHTSPGSADFHNGSIDLIVRWLHELPELHAIPRSDTATWEFLAAGVLWSVTKHLADRCQHPDTPANPLAQDLSDIIQGFFS